jgi:hypothetical protein
MIKATPLRLVFLGKSAGNHGLFPWHEHCSFLFCKCSLKPFH